MSDYYDMLASHAFGNYRDLLEDVTLHPAMGVYLSMVRNEKANPAENVRPDENYARVSPIQLEPLVEITSDIDALLDWYNLVFFSGNMPDHMRQLLFDYARTLPDLADFAETNLGLFRA